jgi:NAD(P)H-dependent FMN reductase
MSAPKIIAFAGSLRAGSHNKKLLAIGVEAARAEGAEVTVVDLRELALPLYDGDIEDATGLPEGAKRFKALLRASDGMLVASPEYNSSITGALKNAIDWASRAETDDEPSLVAFDGKAAALLAASPGGFGGLRGLVTVRSILSNIGVHVHPDQVCIPVAHEAFDEAGKLKDEKKTKQVAQLAKGLVDLASRLKS